MSRIAVLGCQASGKTFLSKRIGVTLGLPVYHLDEFIWSQRDSYVSIEDNNRKIIELLEEENWIIDGTYWKTVRDRLLACDRAIFLNTGRWTCLMNMLQKRIGCVLRLKRARPFETISFELIRHIWKNNRRFNASLRETTEQTGALERTVVLNSRREIRSFIRGLRESPERQA